VNTPNAQIGGKGYQFAGTNAGSTVSVGTVDGERTITNVAAGRISTTSTDAVNGSQLNATNEAVSSDAMNVDQLKQAIRSVVDFTKTATSTFASSGGGTAADAVATGTNATAMGSGATATGAQTSAFGAGAAATGPQTSAFGVGASATGPAASAFGAGASANGPQASAIGAGASATGPQAFAIGAGATASGANSAALGANSVADRDNTVSVGSPGHERQITNVAPGTQGTDAVNVNQMTQSVSQGVKQANAYTDQRFNVLGDQVNSVARYAYSGVAAATALTMIPDVEQGKTIAVGVGTANYKGYQAAALGASARITQNVKLKIGAGLSAAGTAYGAGASYQW
jgi:autotransporter adhesin